MTEPTTTTVEDVLVTLVLIPSGSVLVGFETARRVQQRMAEENPDGGIEVPPLPCVTYTPTTSEELEDAIYAKISQLAEYLKDLMAAYPGQEFASVLWLNSQGQLTASVFTPSPDGRARFDTTGVNYGTVVAMIHGHPLQPMGYPAPLYSPDFPAYGLFPSTYPNESPPAGDFITEDYWRAQITAHGGNASLFRQYIVGFGSYGSTNSANLRPAWHLTQPDSNARKTQADYEANTNLRPAPSLPMGVVPPEC